MAKQELNARALSYTLAILFAGCMLLLGIFGNLGIYTNVAAAMQSWHLFFNLSFVGIIGGMIEAGVWGIISGWLVAWIYNKFL